MDSFQGKTEQKCRVCLTENNYMFYLYDKFEVNLDLDLMFSDVLMICSSIQISKGDLMPQHICESCVEKAKISYNFKLQCERSEIFLKKELLCNTNENVILDSHIGIAETDNGTKETQSNNHIISRVKEECQDSTTIKNIDSTQSFPAHVCKECGMSFLKLSFLQRHLKSHSDTQFSEEQYPCDQCGKKFYRRCNLLRHKRRHGKSSKSCPFCDEIYTTPMLLSHHMEREHSDKKSVICPTCGKTFFRKANLRSHITVHSDAKPHMCEVCGVSFKLLTNLITHRRVHTGERPYACNHCGRRFTQHSTLRSHEVNHFDKKDHMCSTCGATFKRAGTLRNHRKIHESNKPYECPTCHRTFKRSTELRRHVQIHTGERKYGCDVCGKQFNRNSNLKVHRRIHTGEAPYVCSKCDRAFNQAHCLRTHMSTHK